MTDNERMDRAKRIREMREGARDGDDDESPSDETDNRTDGGDPEKQTMEDIVEASEQDASDAADATTETSPSAETTTTETSPSTGEPTAETDPTTSEATTTTMTDTESTTTEHTTADAGTESGDDAGGDSDADGDSGVTAPLPEMNELEEALEGSAATADPETVSPGVADAGDGRDAQTAVGGGETVGQAAARQESVEETTEEETRVLEFTLDDEHYCLDIQYIEEIVKHENITRVPNTPGHVEGVVDLRGQITTILNPKVTIGKENDDAGELIVVFDAEAFEDQGYIGWVVDDVRQVSPIVESEVNDPPMAEDYINGVIDREDDDEFVIWTSPDLAFEDGD